MHFDQFTPYSFPWQLPDRAATQTISSVHIKRPQCGNIRHLSLQLSLRHSYLVLWLLEVLVCDTKQYWGLRFFVLKSVLSERPSLSLWRLGLIVMLHLWLSTSNCLFSAFWTLIASIKHYPWKREVSPTKVGRTQIYG